jgi:hypothetical protein
MPIDTSSPESAYCTKGNILLPKTDTRTAAAVQAVALTQEQTVNPNLTVTAVVAPTKEP